MPSCLYKFNSLIAAILFPSGCQYDALVAAASLLAAVIVQPWWMTYIVFFAADIFLSSLLLQFQLNSTLVADSILSDGCQFALPVAVNLLS